eukprot:s5081_g2.t1
MACDWGHILWVAFMQGLCHLSLGFPFGGIWVKLNAETTAGPDFALRGPKKSLQNWQKNVRSNPIPANSASLTAFDSELWQCQVSTRLTLVDQGPVFLVQSPLGDVGIFTESKLSHGFWFVK